VLCHKELLNGANFESVFLCWKLLPEPFIMLEKPIPRLKIWSPKDFLEKWKLEDENKSVDNTTDDESKSDVSSLTDSMKHMSVSSKRPEYYDDEELCDRLIADPDYERKYPTKEYIKWFVDKVIDFSKLPSVA